MGRFIFCMTGRAERVEAGVDLELLFVFQFIGRTDAEAEAPILWSLDAKSQLTGKDPDAGKD